MSFTLQVELPEIFLVGKYILNGNLFFASIRGNGDFSANISKYKYKLLYTLLFLSLHRGTNKLFSCCRGLKISVRVLDPDYEIVQI